MPVKITNVSLNHEHAMKRRTASRLQMEPVIAGERLRLRSSRILTDEQYEINKKLLEDNVNGGVVKVEILDAQGEPTQVLEGKDDDVLEETAELPVSDVPSESSEPPAPPTDASIPLASTPPAETSSTTATTQPLPNMSRKDKNKGR